MCFVSVCSECGDAKVNRMLQPGNRCSACYQKVWDEVKQAEKERALLAQPEEEE